MVLVFILLGFIIFIILLFFLLLFSTLKIQIKDFEISSNNEKRPKKYCIILSLLFAKKIKWLSICLDEEKRQKILKKIAIEKINIKQIEKDINFHFKDIQYFKKLDLELSDFHFLLNIGLEDVILTSYLIAILSTIISALLPHVVKTYKKENYEYFLNPIYQSKNIYEMKLNCIIQVKMVHIINIIYIFWKKKGRSEKNERTSNRRPYGYGYE